MNTLPESKSSSIFPSSRSQRFPLMQATPHLQKGPGVRSIMGNVLLALLPAFLCSLYLFGFGVLPYYILAITAALAADILVQWVKKRGHIRIDLSAAVTGTLLAMSLPMGAPLWFPLLGAAFGVIVAKELFGGIGRNFLNPALAGRALLRLAFPLQMLQNPVPHPPFGFGEQLDATAGATTLMLAKQGTSLTGADLLDAFIGNVPGKIGETSALLLLIGAAWLIYKGIIQLRIPLSFLAATALMAFAFGGSGGLFSADWQTIAAHLLGGATILGAFFMLTDYGSSPSAPVAQYLFGALCGIVNTAFRLFGPYAESFTFAILLVNCSVPLFNRYIRPRVLGEGKRAKETA